MSRVIQEFYCNACRGYFLVPLNMAINRNVKIICPNTKCKHEHYRGIRDGQIRDDANYHEADREVIHPPRSTYSKTPPTKAMREADEKKWDERDGRVVPPPMYERWLEIAQREKGEDCEDAGY